MSPAYTSCCSAGLRIFKVFFLILFSLSCCRLVVSFALTVLLLLPTESLLCAFIRIICVLFAVTKQLSILIFLSGCLQISYDLFPKDCVHCICAMVQKKLTNISPLSLLSLIPKFPDTSSYSSFFTLSLALKPPNRRLW